MKENYIRGIRGSLFVLLEVLFVLGMIAFLSGRVINNYFKNSGPSYKTYRASSTQVITPGNYKSNIDDARETVRVINQRISNRENYINQNIRKAHK
jgi:hypothetical protein